MVVGRDRYENSSRVQSIIHSATNVRRVHISNWCVHGGIYGTQRKKQYMNYILKYLARRKGSKVSERKKGPLAGQLKRSQSVQGKFREALTCAETMGRRKTRTIVCGQTTYCSKECILYPVGNREAF